MTDFELLATLKKENETLTSLVRSLTNCNNCSKNGWDKSLSALSCDERKNCTRHNKEAKKDLWSYNDKGV